MTTYETITLGLGNRDDVFDFINQDGEAHRAHEPEDRGSDVVIVDLHDHNRAVVALGDTVRRSPQQFEIIRGDKVRTSFPRVPISDEERARDIAIDRAQEKLAEALNDAGMNLADAQRWLADLIEGDAWHVEYAETSDGLDLDTELAAAARAVRNAQRIVREVMSR